MKQFGKSLLLAVIGSTILSTSATAQNATVGVHAGATVYNPSADIESMALSAKEGLVIGGMAELLLLDQLGFRFGIDYALKEAKFQTTSGSTSGTYSLNYLDIPVNLKFRFGSDALAFYIFGGTTLGALLSATSEGDQGTGEAIDDQLKTVDVSVDLGGGVDVGLTDQLALVAEGTYSFGLLDMAEEGSSSLDEWKARTLKLVLGVNYRIL